MKTKQQKQEELRKGKELLEKSNVLIFTDFTNVTAENLRRLRRELKASGAAFLVIKKRLLNLLFKEKGIEFDSRKFKLSLGTVFSQDIEKAAGVVFKLMKELNVEKEKIIGGYDIAAKNFIESEKVLMIGQLPSREVLLAQLASVIAAPLRSLLYILSEKSQRSS